MIVDVLRLTKPRLTAMVVATAVGGMWLAVRSGAAPPPRLRLAVAAPLAIALIVAGAGALNMVLERDTDALMARTRSRPLPAGRLSPAFALGFGLALSLSATAVLWWAAGGLTAGLAVAAWLLYVLVYTPLKRRTSLSLWVGAVAGAMPPLLGWTAATGRIGSLGLILAAVMFFWQLPHFLAIATLCRDDYRRAGILVLTPDRGRWRVRVVAGGHALAAMVASLALVPLGAAGLAYAVVAALLGAALLGAALALRPQAPVRPWARRLFVGSLLYVLVLFLSLALVG